MGSVYFIILLMASFFVNSDESEARHMTMNEIQIAEKLGVNSHKKGNYEKAFIPLTKAAELGMKQPQYLLGIMYLKGQYVDQAIDKGMAWLGVANEINKKEWRITYDNVYNMLNAAQKKYVDNKVVEYVGLYGLQAQDVSCEKRASRERAKKEFYCLKNDSDLYPEKLSNGASGFWNGYGIE